MVYPCTLITVHFAPAEMCSSFYPSERREGKCREGRRRASVQILKKVTIWLGRQKGIQRKDVEYGE